MAVGSYIDRPGISSGGGTLPLRQHVLLRGFRDAQDETGLAESKFAEDLARHYLKHVPESVRRIDLPGPDDLDCDANTMRGRLDKLRKRVENYANGQWHMPVELEEAWCAALPEPYSTRCRRQLARRLGFVGVEISNGAKGAANDLTAATSVTGAAANAVNDIVAMLENDVIGPEDAHLAPQAMENLDAVIAAAYAAKAHIAERTGYSQVTPLKGREAA